MKYVAAIILIAIFSSRVFADEIAIMGPGTQTCGQFANHYQQSTDTFENLYFGWAQGFMSGLNAHAIHETGNSQNLGSMSVEQQKQYLRNYCNKSPLADYAIAVRDLYLQFTPNSPVKK